MDPKDLIKDEKAPSDKDEVLHTVLSYYDESKSLRNKLEHRWNQNAKLVKGIPLHREKQGSTVRNRPKMRFRKIWSTVIRLLSSLYQAFLMDKNKFTIKGFDEFNDFMKAKILHEMTRYRLNWLYRRRDGFTKFIWAFLDCISPGTGIVKVHWKYNEEQEIDEPSITNYPLEQTCLDWTAATVSDMRFCILENYLTKEQLKEMAYDNIEKATAVALPVSLLRETRWHNVGDPMRAGDAGSGRAYSDGTVGSSYPAPGSHAGSETIKDVLQDRYRVLECFYKKDGKIYLAVLNPESSVWLSKPIVSPYGRMYPIAVGSLLLEAHKIIPESLVEPLEGPQEDLNMSLNLRKDNQLLAMMGGWSIDKYGGVDRQALSNLRPGFVVTRNSGQGIIEPIRLPDVTQTSYVEANADQVMIDEMSGITPVKQGNTTTSKTGVAQINLQESNAKESLFTAIVGETLFKQVIYLLAYHIQLFETDEKIFKVANGRLRQQGILPQQHDNIYDIEFDMDIEIEVGNSEVSRAALLQRKMALTDRALQSNNSTLLLLRSGIKIKNPTIIDTGKIVKDMSKDLGFDNFNEYIVPVEPPEQQQPKQPGQGGQAEEGAAAPQPNQRSAEIDEGFNQAMSRGFQ